MWTQPSSVLVALVASGLLKYSWNTPGLLNITSPFVGDLDLDLGRRLADRVRLDLAVGLDGDEDAGFGAAVELLQVDAERAVEIEDIRPDRLAGGVGQANPAEAQGVLERAVDQELAEP